MSKPLQLLEMATTPGVDAAVTIPLNRSEKALVGVTTSTIFAPGATACTHSTSSVVSVAHPLLASPEKFDSVGVPITVRFTGGSPMADENACASVAIVVEPKAS